MLVVLNYPNKSFVQGQYKSRTGVRNGKPGPIYRKIRREKLIMKIYFFSFRTPRSGAPDPPDPHRTPIKKLKSCSNLYKIYIFGISTSRRIEWYMIQPFLSENKKFDFFSLLKLFLNRSNRFLVNFCLYYNPNKVISYINRFLLTR